MKAAVLTSFGQPLVVDDIAAPQPADGEALLRVRATGLCGTDLKAWRGALPGVAVPRVLGHEVAGEVVGGATDLAAGTRVACYLYDACGACAACRAGRPTLCGSAVRVGLERDGGLAEYLTVAASTLLPLPDGVSYPAGAVAMDAVASVWAALLGAGALRRGEHVLVAGAGGLGLNAVQVAGLGGARVAAVDVDAPKLELARQAGVELAVRPERLGEVVDWSGGGVDLALEVSGSRAGFRAAAGVVRPGGRIVCCGYQPGTEYGVDSVDLVLNELTIVGSRSATIDQARAALDAVARGDVVPRIDRHLRLDDAQAGLDALAEGAVAGRLVVEL